mmetsp:Transcript_7908/g.16736  ORF Transcript_7908/g.16736 Transcript_7908/m.16736 type:complete len:175 (-) Transcript_7908:163-687(-)
MLTDSNNTTICSQGASNSNALVVYVPPRPITRPLNESWRHRNGSKEGRKRLLVSPTPAPVISILTPQLPPDVFPIVLSFCDAPSLCRASLCCREFQSLCLSDALWENLCRTRFGVCPDQLRPRPDPAKMLYALTHRKFREVCRTSVGPGAAVTHNPFIGRMPRTVQLAPLGGSW